MTATDVRQTLLDAHAGGLVWEDFVHRANVLAGQRVLSLWTLRRFALGGRPANNATFYWLERVAEQLVAEQAAAR